MAHLTQNIYQITTHPYKSDSMSEAKQQITMETIYAEIISMRNDIRELKSVVIQEDEPLADEIEILDQMVKERTSGKYRSWRVVKEELENL